MSSSLLHYKNNHFLIKQTNLALIFFSFPYISFAILSLQIKRATFSPFLYFLKEEQNRKIKLLKFMSSTKSFTKFAAQNLNSIK